MTAPGADSGSRGRTLEAVEDLIRAAPQAAGLVRALSGEGIRIRKAERQTRRALAAAGGGGGGRPAVPCF